MEKVRRSMTYDSLELQRQSIGSLKLLPFPYLYRLVCNCCSYIIISIFVFKMAYISRAALSTRLASRAIVPAAARLTKPSIASRSFQTSSFKMSQHPIATLQVRSDESKFCSH